MLSVRPECKSMYRRYCGNPSSNSICKEMTDTIKDRCVYSTRVCGMERCAQGWQLRGVVGKEDRETDLGCFNVVIWSSPSNGHDKWNRLYGMPPPISAQTAPTLGPTLAELDVFEPCFSVMLVFDRKLLELPFDLAFVKGSDKLAKVVCDSCKPGRQELLPSPEWQTWVLLSNTEYAKHVLSTAPPGSAPAALLEQVAAELVAALRDASQPLFDAASSVMPEPIFAKGHRWGAAYPAAIMREPTLSEPGLGILVCGDFCVSPDIEGAVKSGYAAAEAAAKMRSPGALQPRSSAGALEPSAQAAKIAVANPIVDLDGDEMSRVMSTCLSPLGVVRRH